MILHIFNDQKKFSKGYFEMLRDNHIDITKMMLIHYGKRETYFDKIGLRTEFISSFFNPFSNIKLLKYAKSADKIIVHSLASPFLLLLMIFSKRIAKKVVWVIWGKDLYFYKMLPHPHFYHKIYEFFRKKAIARVSNICSIFMEDFELACKWYDVKAQNHEMITLYPYALNLTTNNEFENREKISSEKTILLGNSASKTNDHIEALDCLYSCKNEIKKILCPLSYGGEASYIKRVIKHGESLFGNKFVPLCQFIPKDDYFSMMNDVDVGVFNYARQEGLGNIWSLMMQGKTIYMKHETSTTSFFRRNNIVVKDIEDLKTKGLELLEYDILKSNIEILEPLIGVEMSIKKWKEIL